jgi:phosphoribosylformylglycinamidine synthase
VEYSPVPHFDLEEEFNLQARLLAVIQSRLIESAHDVSEGGLFITLAESGFPNNLGFSVRCQDESIRRDAYWFGESQSRVVVSVRKENVDKFRKAMEGIHIEALGEVTGSGLEIDGKSWGSIREWKTAYDTAIEKEMESMVEA